jgi:hypothetical protein
MTDVHSTSSDPMPIARQRAPRNIEKDYCTNIKAAQIALQIVSDILTGQNGADYHHERLTALIDARVAAQVKANAMHRRFGRWVRGLVAR